MSPFLKFAASLMLASTALLFSFHPSATAQVTDATWLGGSANWSDAMQWSVDPLFPNNGNGGTDWRVLLNSGSITVDQLITITDFEQTGGNINGAGDLIVNGETTWTRGNQFGTGQTILNGDVTINVNSTSPNLSRHLKSYGTTNLTGLDLNGGTDGHWENYGTFDFQADGGLGGAAQFTNHSGATLVKSAGSAVSETRVDWDVFNYGIIDAQQGKIRFRNVVAGDGVYRASTGTLAFTFSSGLPQNMEVMDQGTIITGQRIIDISSLTLHGNGKLLAQASGSTSIIRSNTGTIHLTDNATYTPSPNILQNEPFFTDSTGEIVVEAGSTFNHGIENRNGGLIRGGGNLQHVTVKGSGEIRGEGTLTLGGLWGEQYGFNPASNTRYHRRYRCCRSR